MDFTLPTTAPRPIADLYARYRGHCDELAATRAELPAAKAAVENARRADVDSLAGAILSGSDEPGGSSERGARENVERLKVRVEALEAAVDASLDDVVDAIRDASAEWAANCSDIARDGKARFHEAVQAAIRAEADVDDAKVVRDWLGRFGDGRMFRTSGAHGGVAMATRFVSGGGGLRVPVPSFANSFDDHASASQLLNLLNRAVEAVSS
jgi:hypothetical protein